MLTFIIAVVAFVVGCFLGAAITLFIARVDALVLEEDEQ